MRIGWGENELKRQEAALAKTGGHSLKYRWDLDAYFSAGATRYDVIFQGDYPRGYIYVYQGTKLSAKSSHLGLALPVITSASESEPDGTVVSAVNVKVVALVTL